MLVMMAGLPGSGKSTLALELAKKTAGIVLDKDHIRSALFPAAEIEYSSTQDDFCVSVALQTAAYLFHKQPERFIFLDGRPFSKRKQIDRVLAAVAEMKQPWRILECVCSEEKARERLQSQQNEHPAADRDYDLYLRIKAGWEEITRPKTLINTDQSLDVCIALGLQALTQ
jgi:predicted kinase